MYFGIKQGQITPNIENRYALKLIQLVAQCSKIPNTVLFLKRILHHFHAFCCFLPVIFLANAIILSQISLIEKTVSC